MNPGAPERISFFYRFYRALIPPALVLFAILAYYAVFGELQPTAEGEKYSFFTRTTSILLVGPFSIALGFLVMRRARGNLIGPVIVHWGCIASAEFAGGFPPPFWAALSIFYIMVIVFPAFFLMLGVFPTGWGATPFWDRAIKTVTVAIILHSTLINLAAPEAYMVKVPSPLAIPALVPYYDRINWTVPLFGLALVLALGSLVSRYRISNAVRRKQMRWLVLFVVYFLLQLFVGPLVVVMAAPLMNELTSMTLIAVPPAVISIAILRHNLWEIDRIIRRTLQYTILTALLGGIYFGGVVILQEAFTAVTGESDSPLVTVITTLGIAALFSPLRSRIQRFIDRRFYRQKYDAEKALERFSAAARDEVDLEKLTAALVGLVHETVLPEKVSVWLGEDRQ